MRRLSMVVCVPVQILLALRVYGRRFHHEVLFSRDSDPPGHLSLSGAWNASEFNIIGDGGGSQAVFNRGASVTVEITATSGSTAAPKCVANAGTTGETNNLTLGTC